MKQKMVIKITLNGKKSRSKALQKALQIAVSFSGVESAALTGDEKTEIEVVGDVDAVELTSRLRKKMASAVIKSVGPPPEKKKPDEKPTPAVVLYPDGVNTLSYLYPYQYYCYPWPAEDK